MTLFSGVKVAELFSTEFSAISYFLHVKVIIKHGLSRTVEMGNLNHFN